MHQSAAYEIEDELVEEPLLHAARESWDEAVALGEQHGYRNAQATVLAPTGTISFLMDCDTTGIEPDFSLVKFKELVGGGQMKIVNRSVNLALETLGYSESEIEQIDAYINEHNTIIGAPGLKDEHLEVFDVAVGERSISHTGHIDMMAAAQPFLSGAISKTVNLPESATISDIADAYSDGWRKGLKALAIYRDGSKTAQALKTDAGEKKDADVEVVEAAAAAQEDAARAGVDHPQVPDRDAGGLHHRRQVPGRLGRRDLPHRHRQGGLDDQGPDERLRDRDLDRPPVRRAARGLRAASSATCASSPRGSRPTRRSRSPSRCPTTSCAGSPAASSRTPTTSRASAILTDEVRAKKEAQQAFPIEDDRRLAVERRATATRTARATANGAAKAEQRGVEAGDRRAHRHPAGRPGEDRSRPRAGPGVRPVRRHDAAHGLLLHVLELRQQHRLRLAATRPHNVERPAKAGRSCVTGALPSAGSQSPARSTRVVPAGKTMGDKRKEGK